MKEIYYHLYVGSTYDYEHSVKDQEGWFVIHACREPYHRLALGYKGRKAPSHNPEYFCAYRAHSLSLNLEDAKTAENISKQVIDEAIKAIDFHIINEKVLVQCNLGMSRSAAIGLLYLHHLKIVPTDFIMAEREYRKLYHWYKPKNGIRSFIQKKWDAY